MLCKFYLCHSCGSRNLCFTREMDSDFRQNDNLHNYLYTIFDRFLAALRWDKETFLVGVN